MSISTKVGKIIMAKHMILACIFMSMLFITVAGNDDQTYFHKLKAMQRTLKANRFQRQLLEKRYAVDERKNDKFMHAINHAEDQTEFQLQNHIDNIASTNNVEKEHMKKVDTIGAKFAPTKPKEENVTTHTANQINKREQLLSDSNDLNNQMDYTCHVTDHCKHRPFLARPCAVILSRADWEARDTRSVSYMKKTVSTIFIHHTAMTRCFTSQECILEMKKIQDLHMDTNGWDDIGYSFLVGDNGMAYEARGWNRVGAHTRGWNSVSVSIAVMGNFNEVLPSDAALNAIDSLISCGINTSNILTNYTLYGHRAASQQFDSPGHMLNDLIQTWPHHAHISARA